MQFLDFSDFLTNSVMMPIAAFCICLLVTIRMGTDAVEEEVEKDGHPFKRKGIFNFTIRYLSPFILAVILISSVASVFGLISM
jgi:NSS family neurotransmitter:Na+ symporter